VGEVEHLARANHEAVEDEGIVGADRDRGVEGAGSGPSTAPLSSDIPGCHQPNEEKP
jgi:hypothetical protein